MVHVVDAVVTRTYNPGLWTALVLFVPSGGWGLSIANEANGFGVWGHALEIAIAVLVHGAIVVSVK